MCPCWKSYRKWPLAMALCLCPFPQLTNVDVVRFPCGVLITEVRVVPPGIKAHSSLPDSRAFGWASEVLNPLQPTNHKSLIFLWCIHFVCVSPIFWSVCLRIKPEVMPQTGLDDFCLHFMWNPRSVPCKWSFLLPPDTFGAREFGLSPCQAPDGTFWAECLH